MISLFKSLLFHCYIYIYTVYIYILNDQRATQLGNLPTRAITESLGGMCLVLRHQQSKQIAEVEFARRGAKSGIRDASAVEETGGLRS